MPPSRSRSRPRSPPRSRSRSRTRSVDGEEEEYSSGNYTDSQDDDHGDGGSQSEDDNEQHDIKSFNFCKDHSPGNLIRSCPQCSVALSVLSDKKLISKLFGESEAGTSGLKSRFSGSNRCDQTVPSMSLTDEVVEAAREMLAKGQFKNKKCWDDVIKKHLTLPLLQHQSLTNDLKNEDIFNKCRKEKRFWHIFKYQGEIRDCVKNYRLSERPVLKVVETLNELMLNARKFGEDNGIEYPESPPPRTGANVPREVRSTPNNLIISSAKDAFPRSSMTKLFESLSVDLSEADREKIIDNLEDYRVDVGKKVVKFYNSVTESLNDIEDLVCLHHPPSQCCH